MQRLRELRGAGSPTTTSIPLQTSDYRALRQKDFELEEDEDEDTFTSASHRHGPPSRTDNELPVAKLSTLTSIAATPWILHLLLLLLNILTFAYLLQKAPSDATCIKNLSSWSPAIDSGIVRYKTIPIGAENSQYKGLSNAQVDEAWTNITSAVPKLRISATELKSLKKKPTAEAPQKDESGFTAQLQVYELLGCLNKIRNANNRWHAPGSKGMAIRSDEEINHDELDLCIDILRVEVMCTSDVDLVTYKDGERGLQPDFSGVKKCRGFDDILDWSYAIGKKVGASSNLQDG